MSAELILAIDQGTTGTTCLLLDHELKVLAKGYAEFPQHFPQPGWVEHDPWELWASVQSSLALALDGVDTRRIRAIGITNQRETSLIWERATGRPLHRALVWQDRRTSKVCEQLREAGELERVQARTGLVLDPYFSGTKLAWTLDHVDGARARAEAGELAAGTIDTYLLWRLSGGQSHATEPSNASRTLLWPLAAKASESPRGWDAEMCELFRVPAKLLPDVLPCTSRFGETRGLELLPDGIPIHGIAGDQQAALFGQTCFARGEAKCTYGTGAFVMLNTGEEIVRSAHGLLTTVGWEIDGETSYCLEGSAFMAGAVVQWLRDQLGFFETAPEIEAMATSVPDSGGVILVPAHAGLGAPHWRPDARGLLSGLTRGTSRAHIARAALEGIALEVSDLLEAMSKDLGGPLAQLRVDGGASANNFLMQTQADLLGVPLVRPSMLETTALGATFLAGLGSGLWTDREELRSTLGVDREFVAGAPSSSSKEALDDLRQRWTRAVEVC